MEDNKKILIKSENNISLGICENISGLSGYDIVLVNGERFHRIFLKSCKPEDTLKKLVDKNEAYKLDEKSPCNYIYLYIDDLKCSRYSIDVYSFEYSKPIGDGYDICLYAKLYDNCAHSENEIKLWSLVKENNLSRGFWRDYNIDDKYALLKINRLIFCSDMSVEIPIYNGEIYYLNGKNIVDIPSLFLEIGESIRGKMGYFGGDFLSLNDCISGSRVENGCFKVVWKNHGVSRYFLNEYAFLCDSIESLKHNLRSFDYAQRIDELLDDPEFLFKCRNTPFDEVCSIFGKMLILD